MDADETQGGQKHRLTKIEISGSVQDLIDGLTASLPSFLAHVRIKRAQAAAFACHVNDTTNDGKRMLLQCDFAENYECSYQDEIQGAHWNKAHVTIFTMSAKHGSNSFPNVVISDDLRHDKKSIMTFITRFLADFLLQHPEVQRCDVWSDGPSSQFKNKFIAAFVCHLRQTFNLSFISWNYFATSHGKSSIDALGATVKRVACRRSLAKGREITVGKDATSFYDAVKDLNMSIMLVLKEEIETFANSSLIKTIIEESPPIVGIASAHCMGVLCSRN